MKRPRFTVRALMVFVALAALTAWGYHLWHRSKEFAARADGHKLHIFTETVDIDRIIMEYPAAHYPLRRKAHLTPSEVSSKALHERLLEYETMMYEKYRRAARYPWLPVAPDPSPPPGRW